MRSESNSRKAGDKNETAQSPPPPTSQSKWNPAEIRPNSITVFRRNILAYSKVDWSFFLGLYIKAQWVEWFYTLGLFRRKKVPAELSNRYPRRSSTGCWKTIARIPRREQGVCFLAFHIVCLFTLIHIHFSWERGPFSVCFNIGNVSRHALKGPYTGGNRNVDKFANISNTPRKWHRQSPNYKIFSLAFFLTKNKEISWRIR